METGKKNWSVLKEKIKTFFDKTLMNKRDSTYDSNVKDQAYRKSHEKMKMY